MDNRGHGWTSWVEFGVVRVVGKQGEEGVNWTGLIAPSPRQLGVTVQLLKKVDVEEGGYDGT